MKEIKKQCYFFGEYMDMGGTVPVCGCFGAQGNPPCEGCKNYITKSEVTEFVRFLLRLRNNANIERDVGPALENIADKAAKAAEALRKVRYSRSNTKEG